MKNIPLILGVIALVSVGALVFMRPQMTAPADVTPATNTPSVDMAMPVPGSNVPEMVVENSTTVTTTTKEFVMNAYYDEKGKWFSIKEISVKKGDIVRIKVTNTKGMHDFVIDELGVKEELLLNQEVVIEFTADKVGDFVYYCSMPGHREGGQWGTLKITE